MNKLICLVLAAVLALSLAACGSAPAAYMENVFAIGHVSEVCYTPNELELNVKITMNEMGDANIGISICSEETPLALIQALSISKLRLQTAQTEYILDGQYDEKMQIKDGKGNMTLSIDADSSTEYQLIITELTGYAKGEGPLLISGNWIT